MHIRELSAFTILILLIGVRSTAALQCYTCRNTENCKDPFKKDNSGVSVNSSSLAWCWKVKAEGSGLYGVARGAGSITEGRETYQCKANKCEEETVGDFKATICCCNTDFCNSAGRLCLTGFIFLTTLLLFIIRY
ncbi:unnamed protein product [Rotaria magnacalcarata]|uniref:Protein quiver n=1 Tax=Rotaria magnacalcarata TaxID=392030 RepID=A0A816AE66_9BILA|nr:unnamed protein product [Rotaria magnacalcarata]CAF1596299.1 unnamed protein product [Rotaria magnacalcarata]CAF2067906.1 unnamed protein product [Rotaria magnacalcarata]CAF2090570.1 unnamed protein product [Rotaria magnacalcarata]CAF2110525.1 unnamed protein product [Rotaria magnacalcarata]